jgi:hypothetical protein
VRWIVGSSAFCRVDPCFGTFCKVYPQRYRLGSGTFCKVDPHLYKLGFCVFCKLDPYKSSISFIKCKVLFWQYTADNMHYKWSVVITRQTMFPMDPSIILFIFFVIKVHHIPHVYIYHYMYIDESNMPRQN